MKKSRAFTLMELMVAVIIIAVLAAVAVPQYKKAILKSRFSMLMPIGKSLAKGNEAYYVENGEYATQRTELDVGGQSNYPEGVTIKLATDPEYLSYVRVENPDKVPTARYVVYQKYSANFADTTMCEANDDTAKDLCQRLGGVFVSENGTEEGWAAYLLSGAGGNSKFGKVCREADVELTAECGDGYNEKTRTVIGCDNDEGEWTYSAWDDSECCKGAQQLTEKCEDGYQDKTRTVTGCSNGSWTYSDWNEDRCCTGPQVLTEKCEDGYEDKTRTVTGCNNGTWSYSSWDEARCCKEADKVLQHTCESGCGTQTHNVTGCSNGVWTYDNWVGACASDKPDDITLSCGNGHTGEIIYTYACNASGPTWTKHYQSDTCDSTWTGSCSSSCNSSGSVTSTRPCRNQVFISDGTGCTGGCNGSCASNVYAGTNTSCTATGTVGACLNGQFIGDGSYCQSARTDYRGGTCNDGTYTGQGAHCISTGSYRTSTTFQKTCGNSTFKTGTYCQAGGTGSCSGSTYEGTACCYATVTGYCPTGTPKCRTTKTNNTYEWDGTYW